MITLIVHTGSSKIEHSFDQDTVTISYNPLSEEILLNDLEGDNAFLVIHREEDRHFAINTANNPNIRRDGQVFERTELNHGDILSFYNSTITFVQETALLLDLDEELRKLDLFSQTSFNESPFISNEALEEMDLHSLFMQVEQLEKENQAFELPAAPPSRAYLQPECLSHSVTNSKATTAKNVSLRPKEHIGYDADDPMNSTTRVGQQHHYANHSTTYIPPRSSWMASHRYATVAILLLTMIGVLGGGTFFAINIRNYEQEQHAAQGLADIAMALLHSKMTQQATLEHHWNDQEFLEENLQAVLSSKYRARSNVGSNGELLHCSYKLQLTVDPSESRFLLTARPKHTLTQWLIPKKSLAIDSQTMTIHRIRDERLLEKAAMVIKESKENRPSDLAFLINDKTLIPLSSLEPEGHRLGFVPPAELADLLADSQNRIYNAPRYYKLSRLVIQTASRLEENKATPRDVSALSSLIHTYCAFDDWVFYCSQGKAMAWHALRGLERQQPQRQFLVGYLEFHAEDGLIADTHLVSATNEEESAAKAHSHPRELEVNRHHPLFVELTHLAGERQRALQNSSQRLISYIEQNNSQPTPEFLSNFRTLIADYEHQELQQNSRIASSLDAIRKQYTLQEAERQIYVPAYIEAVGLESYYYHEMGNKAPKPRVAMSTYDDNSSATTSVAHGNANGDTLDIRRQAINGLKSTMVSALTTRLGFSPSKQALVTSLDVALRTYKEVVSSLASLSEEQQQQPEYETLRNSQKVALEKIVAEAQTLQKECYQFNQDYSTYLTRMEQYLKEYERAKDAGLCNGNQRQHIATISQLKKRIKTANDLKSQVQQASYKLQKVGFNYEAIARSELNHFANQERISPELLGSLEMRTAYANQYNPTEDEVTTKLMKLLATDL